METFLRWAAEIGVSDSVDSSPFLFMSRLFPFRRRLPSRRREEVLCCARCKYKAQKNWELLKLSGIATSLGTKSEIQRETLIVEICFCNIHLCCDAAMVSTTKIKSVDFYSMRLRKREEEIILGRLFMGFHPDFQEACEA